MKTGFKLTNKKIKTMKRTFLFIAMVVIAVVVVSAQPKPTYHPIDCTPIRERFIPGPVYATPPSQQPITVTVNIDRTADGFAKDFWVPILFLLLLAGLVFLGILLWRRNSVVEHRHHHHYDEKTTVPPNPGWNSIPKEELEFLKSLGKPVFYHRFDNGSVKIDVKESVAPSTENKEKENSQQ